MGFAQGLQEGFRNALRLVGVGQQTKVAVQVENSAGIPVSPDPNVGRVVAQSIAAYLGEIQVDAKGLTTATITVTGTWTGTILVQGTNNGVQWANLRIVDPVTLTVQGSIGGTAIAQSVEIGGFTAIRVIQADPGTTGTAVITISAQEGDSFNHVISSSFKTFFNTSYPSGQTELASTTQVTLNATTWTLIPVTAAANNFNIQNISGIDIKVNFGQPSGYVGMLIPDGGERGYQVKGTLPLYAKSASGTPTIDVEVVG